MQGIYDDLNKCLANLTPPPPPPPTPVSCPLACGGGEIVVGRGPAPMSRGLGAFSLASRSAAPAPCSVTFLDPLPLNPGDSSLMNGNAINGSPAVLGQGGRPVQGIAADGAARVVIRISASQVGENFSLTVVDEFGRSGQPYQQVGWLNSINGSEGSEHAGSLTIVAKSAGGSAMAFAVYHPPTDFSRGTWDDSKDNRFVTLQANSLLYPDYTPSAPLNIFRPPVVLVNGLWGERSDWAAVTNPPSGASYSFKQFSVTPIFYDEPLKISYSIPWYSQEILGKARANSLGFSYNAPSVLAKIAEVIRRFRNGGNALANQAAGTQVDAIGHSMGGLVTRTLEKLPAFADQSSFGVGNVHKLITIGTPHLGSPLAAELLLSSNDCVRGKLAGGGNIAFSSVTLAGSSNSTTGAVFDLQGDDHLSNVPMSPALKAIQAPANPKEAQTALIAAKMSQANLDGLSCVLTNSSGNVCSSTFLQSVFLCNGSPLAMSLTVSQYPTVFAEPDGTNDSDSVVSLTSQLAGAASHTGSVFPGVIHSSGMEKLDFVGPAELDSGSGIPARLPGLLNAPLDPAPGDPRAGAFTFYRLSQ